ncbi:MAG: DASS family sodium-coupled anion symporter [Candidatus Aminicenantes bacterium]|nr:DASS family sodium-coupled anion symporter [Candidatus Aminicenantes bacterium]
MNSQGRPQPRFDLWRRRVGFFLGPLIFLIIWFLPLPSLPSAAHRLAAIVSWVVIWWIGEPIPLPMTAILGIILCVLFGVTDIKTALIPFSDPVIFLFMGSFIIARSMTYHGLDYRLALRILSWKWVRQSPLRLLFMLGLTTACLSMWISNTATTAMMYPLSLGLISMLQKKTRETRNDQILLSTPFATAFLLMTGYASTVGGIGTPVGTPPNLITLAMLNKLAQIKVSFFQWMLFALPMLLCMYFVLFGLLYWLHHKGIKDIKRREKEEESLNKKSKTYRPWTKGEKNTLLVFILTIILWVSPGISLMFFGESSALNQFVSQRIPEAVAALIGASLLFLLPVDLKKGEMTLSWKQATEIDWGTLILFGGGLSLGDLMFKTGLASAVGQSLLAITGNHSVWLLTLIGIYITNFLTETTSNTASATMMVPVMISIAMASGLNPLPPALGCAFGASLAFTMPVSTPPNAIVYGSGLIPITKMIRAGILMSLSGGLVVWVILRLFLPLYGLA